MLFQNFSANLPKSATQYGCSLIALAFVSLVTPAGAQETKTAPETKPVPEASASPAKDGDKKDADKDDQAGAIDSIPMQLNQPIKGLQFPSYDANNKLQMMLTADVATKIDPGHIELQNMKIDATGDDGKNFHVELPYSIFEISTRILNGDKGVLIKREDFELTGDTGEFYLKTRFAKVLKHVKMTIFSLPATPTPSPTPKKETPAKS